MTERSNRQRARDRNLALLAVILYNVHRDPAKSSALHLEELMGWAREKQYFLEAPEE